MERNSKSLEIIIKELIALLQENDEPDWAACLSNLLVGYMDPKTRLEAVNNILKIYQGGMGSFIDLVLQKDFKMLVNENELLANLRYELYNACLNYSTDPGDNFK